MSKRLTTVSADALADYRAAFSRPEVRHAMIQDYRAAATIDEEHDLADKRAGRRLDCPVLVLWEEGRFPHERTPIEVWSKWTDRVEGRSIRSGHLLPEEAPDAVWADVRPFLARHLR